MVPYLLRFIGDLTNVYVRYNRKRLKGSKGPQDCAVALASLFDVLLTVCKVMAPFTPFFTGAALFRCDACDAALVADAALNSEDLLPQHCPSQPPPFTPAACRGDVPEPAARAARGRPRERPLLRHPRGRGGAGVRVWASLGAC